MEYLYFLPNTSLTLRVIEYLKSNKKLPLGFVTVVHLIEGWVVRLKMIEALDTQTDGDLRAFFSEHGITYQAPLRLQMALWSLETGQSPVNVMRRYQVAIVSHGKPDSIEVETFREQFVKGLGYCPAALA